MAYNLITGSGNFTDSGSFCLIGSASWTGSTTRDELYVQGQLKTDIYYDIGGTSSIFSAQMNYSASGVNYTFEYTGALSGSVTNLQDGTYADYYVDTWWGTPNDILYTFDPYVTRSLDANGHWEDAAGGAWKTGWKFAFLKRRTDGKIMSMCTYYPVSSSLGESIQYVSPGVNGYFCMIASGNSTLTDLGTQTPAGKPKQAQLRLVAGDVILATTNDAPPPAPEPEVTFSFNPQVRQFSAAIILPP